jgi:cytochrome c-type biogenesis protein CcmH
MGQFMFIAILASLLAGAFAVSMLWQRSRALALALALVLPLAAGALSWFQGRTAAPEPASTPPPKTIEQATVQLEQLVRANPDNFGDQVALARAYMAGKQWDKARDAYARALRLQDDAALSVEYAEALLRTSPDQRFPPQAVAMLEQALQADPNNQRALYFLGLHQRQNGQNEEAAQTWQRLLALVDPETGAGLRAQIELARKDAGLPPDDADKPLLDIEVRLDPTLAREFVPGAVLYVFARKADGAGPPIAVRRLTPDKFPINVQLGDGDSPMPAALLSSQSEVSLAARLSRSGDAAPASGDLEADPVNVKPGEGAHAELVLNRTVP